MDMNRPDVVKKLRKMAENDPLAEVFFGWLASYSNAAAETSVTSAEKKVSEWVKNNQKNGTSLVRGDIIRIMKTLDELEVGRFWNGRRGADSRFEFWVHRGNLGKAALGQIDNLEIEEDVDEIEEDEIIEIHRRLIAHALDKPLSAVRIKIKEV
jgi:hypothetical protein